MTQGGAWGLQTLPPHPKRMPPHGKGSWQLPKATKCTSTQMGGPDSSTATPASPWRLHAHTPCAQPLVCWLLPLEMGPQGQGRTVCASWRQRALSSQHFLTPTARHASDDSPVSQKVTVQLSSSGQDAVRALTRRPAPARRDEHFCCMRLVDRGAPGKVTAHGVHTCPLAGQQTWLRVVV